MDILNLLFLFVLIPSCTKFTWAYVTLNRKRDSGDQQFIKGMQENTEMSLFEYSFTAIITQKDKNNTVTGTKIICGGTIIHPSWILTSPNCFDNKPKLRNIEIRAGIILITLNRYKQQKRSITRILRHQNYKQYDDEYSIALVKVSTPFELSEAVSFAHMSSRPLKISERKSCHTLGFGQPNDNTKSKGILKISLRVLDYKECSSRLKLLKSGKKATIKSLCLVNTKDNHHGQMCGDSLGFPLICDSKIQGVLSNYSLEACNQNHPIIIPDIGYHPNWIRSVTLNLPLVEQELRMLRPRDNSNTAAQQAHNFIFAFLNFILPIIIL